MISTLKFGVVWRFFDKVVSTPQANRLSNSYSIAFKLSTNQQKSCGMRINEPAILGPQHINLRSPQFTVRNHFTSSKTICEVAVLHDTDGGRFYIDIPRLGTADLEYEKIDDLMILKHTNVPPELEGRGLAKILAKEALNYVAKNNLQLEIQCSFVSKYVSKYEPKYIKFMKN